MSLELALAILRRRGLLVVACAVLVGASAFIFSTLQTKKYTASAAILFRAANLDQQASGLASVGSSDPQRDLDTNVRLVKLGDVAAATARIIDHGLTPGEIRDSVSVTSEGQTDLATISATATSPALAAQIANTFAQQFIASRRKVDKNRVLTALTLVQRQLVELTPQQTGGLQGQALRDRAESLRILASLQDGNAELVQRANVPGSPSSPKVPRNTLLGVLLGLLLGAGLAYVRERLDRRMKDPEDVERTFGLPLLGAVPESQAYVAHRNGRVDIGLPVSEGEAFRMVRAHLRYFDVDRHVRTVLVTSAEPGEGKSTVALFLSQAAATMGTRTLLLEADLRRPCIGERVGLSGSPGLVDVLIGQAQPSEAIRSIEVPTGVNGSSPRAALDVLLVGSLPPNPGELIESQAMESLLEWCSRHYELVLIDTPPMSVVSDAIPLLSKVDGVVIVSRLDRGTRDAAARLRDHLRALGAPTLGVVANAYSKRTRGGYDYEYYGRSPQVASSGAADSDV